MCEPILSLKPETGDASVSAALCTGCGPTQPSLVSLSFVAPATPYPLSPAQQVLALAPHLYVSEPNAGLISRGVPAPTKQAPVTPFRLCESICSLAPGAGNAPVTPNPLHGGSPATPILLMGEPILFLSGPIPHLPPGVAPGKAPASLFLIMGEPILFLNGPIPHPPPGVATGEAPASLFLIMGEPILFLSGPIPHLPSGVATGEAPASLFLVMGEPILFLSGPIQRLLCEPLLGLELEPKAPASLPFLIVEAPASLPFLIMGEPILVVGESIQHLLLDLLFLFVCEPILILAPFGQALPTVVGEPVSLTLCGNAEEKKEHPSSLCDPGEPGPWPTPCDSSEPKLAEQVFSTPGPWPEVD